MKVLATKKTLRDTDAFQTARQGGNSLGRVLYGSGKITLRLMYLQSFEVIFDVYYKPGLVERFFSKDHGRLSGNSQKVCMIVEGTRCSPSLYESPLPLYEMDLDPDDCQESTFPKEKIVAQAKRIAMRIVRRHSGRIVTSMELSSYRPFYRPYYVAFYGEVEMGKKVRYIAIEADDYHTDSSL